MNLLFQARTPGGALWLAFAQEAGDAVAAALALAEQEPLLAALEAWLGTPLDPVPAAHPEPTQRLWWAQAGAVQLGLPWPLLAAQTQAPPLALRWPAIELEASVAGLEDPGLPEGEASPGGVLLLPPAFEPSWRVLLHAPAQGLVAEAEWRGPGTELLLCAAPEPAAPPSTPWRVSLVDTGHRTLPELLGWAAASPWQPGALAWLHGPEERRHAGRVAPALGGFGLWLSD